MRTGTVSDVRFVGARRYAVASGHRVFVRDVRGHEILHRLTTGGPIVQGLFTCPMARRLVAKIKGDGFVVWDSGSGRRLRGVPARNVTAYVMPDCAHLVYGTRERRLVQVDLRDLDAVPREGRTHFVPKELVRSAAAGQLFARRGTAVEAFDVDRMAAAGLFRLPGSALRAVPSGDGRGWIVGRRDGHVDVQGLEPWRVDDAPGVDSSSAAVTAELQVAGGPGRILSVDAGGRASLWTARPAPRRISDVPGGPGWRLRLSPDGRTVLVHDGARLWFFAAPRGSPAP